MVLHGSCFFRLNILLRFQYELKSFLSHIKWNTLIEMEGLLWEEIIKKELPTNQPHYIETSKIKIEHNERRNFP